MKQNLSAQKAKTKEKMEKLIDKYYEAFESGSSEADFDISKIEQLMLKQQREMWETLEEATGDMANEVEARIKKNARAAKKV